jgi:hypothetical protein
MQEWPCPVPGPLSKVIFWTELDEDGRKWKGDIDVAIAGYSGTDVEV